MIFFVGDILCMLCRRTPTTVMIRESHVERMGSIHDVPYEILNVLEFNRFVLFVLLLNIFYEVIAMWLKLHVLTAQESVNLWFVGSQMEDLFFIAR